MKQIFRLLAIVLLLALVVTALSSCAGGMVYDIYIVEIDMGYYGVITCMLDHREAPQTVENFVGLVEDGFYDGLTFHRIKKGFMMQGGCPKLDGTGEGPNKVYGEFWDNGYYGNDIKHDRGVISMARGNAYNSGSCQFFITDSDCRADLDGKYAAFGYVIDGMDTVDIIAMEKDPLGTPGSYVIADKSLQPVISSIKVVDKYNID